MQILSHAPQLGGIIALQVDNGTHPHAPLAGSSDAQTLAVQHVHQTDLQIKIQRFDLAIYRVL